MKLDLTIFGRRALGRLLGPIAELFDRWQSDTAVALALTSRQCREDLPRDEVLRSAHTSGSDFCWIKSPSLEVLVDWRYGPGESVPKVSGAIECSAGRLPELIVLLRDLSQIVGATYGFCDLQQLVDPGTHLDPKARPTYAPYLHFPGLYWYNHFGPEYRANLAVDDSIRSLVSIIEQVEDGGLVVMTRSSPQDPPNGERLAAISASWPFFFDRNPGGRFRRPVSIDYSEIRNLPAAERRAPLPPRALIGDPDEFIASVAARARSFTEWIEKRGHSATTEEEYLRLFQKYEAIIRDEMLVPALAAYGELVRARMGGIWRKATFFNRGEPVVVRPGRPWTTRRVILEVLEGLEPKEL